MDVSSHNWHSSGSPQPPPPNYYASHDAAFVPVQARQVFDRQPQHQPSLIYNHSSASPALVPPPQPVITRKIEWPQPIRDYVQRSFDQESQIEGIAREDIENKLKTIIAQAADKDQLALIDWKNHPLPQQMIQDERTHDSYSSSMNFFPPGFPVQKGNIGHADLNSPSKKRKSLDNHGFGAEENVETLPWRKANSTMLEDRFTYPSAAPTTRSESKRQKKSKEDKSQKASKMSKAELENRQRRFNDMTYSNSVRDTTPPAIQGPVIGTSTTLKKKYLRLTAAPNPNNVRPLRILEQTLELLRQEWRTDNNYSYICDQLKSLRQDLTVQHIKNEFTVRVYELHARIALEEGDLGEFNQCQTQLRALYAQNLGGSPQEFLAYRILYFIHTCNRTDMNDVLADLTPFEKKHHAVAHALDVRSSLALGNYHKFFRLYLETPYMGAYLMDKFVLRERLSALAYMSKAYKQVSIRFITEELGFDTDGHTLQFLEEQGASPFWEERADSYYFNISKAGPTIEVAKQSAFSKVDIKGQK